MLTIVLTKLVATALVVIGVSASVAKLGPRLGGILFMVSQWRVRRAYGHLLAP